MGGRNSGSCGALDRVPAHQIPRLNNDAASKVHCGFVMLSSLRIAFSGASPWRSTLFPHCRGSRVSLQLARPTEHLEGLKGGWRLRSVRFHHLTRGPQGPEGH